MFLLTSRYYDPEIGRFISPDSIDYLDPKSINGLNLYSYCKNNPIMYVDPDGHFPFLIAVALIGLVIGAGIGTGVGVSKGHTGWQLVGDIALGGAIGFGVGLVVGAGISGALTGSFFSSIGTVWNGAKTVYAMYQAAGLAGAGYMMMDNLKNSFHYVTHVFWSGGDIAKEAAADYANTINGTTLEMTRLGQYLSGLPEYNQRAWELASYNFANQVPSYSQVNAILYYPGMRENAIWYTQEIIELGKKFIEIIRGR